MNTKYYEDDDILIIKFSDKKIIKEVSQGWNINISYDGMGEIVQIVILEAKEKGFYPANSIMQRAA
jgi:uncharacterized protein YuzE